MTIDINLSTVISSVLSGLALIGISGIFKMLRLMNGNIRELQEWTRGHERMDDERFESQKLVNKDIWDAIRWIRERLSGWSPNT